MFKPTRLEMVLAGLLVGVLVFWWWGLSEYRDTAAKLGVLQEQVAEFQKDIGKLQNHVKETERVLAAVESLRNQIQYVRGEANAELENSRCYSGNERLERLERLLEADLARRSGGDAAGGASGGLSGARGSGRGFDASEGGEDR